jgi:hypothetical protein
MGTKGSLAPAPGAIYSNVRGSDFTEHVIASAENVLHANEWQHIALTFNHLTGEGRIFVNGQVVASATFGPFIPKTSYPLYFGFRPTDSSDFNGAPPFAGKMDEVTLYNRALTSEEIRTIFSADSAGKCAGPQITTSVLPEAPLGVAYKATIAALRGTSPYTFGLVGGSLPPGLSLSSEGAISGTPTVVGTFDFVVQVKDAAGLVSDSPLEIMVPSCAPTASGVLSWWPADGDGLDIANTNDLHFIDITFGPGEAGQALQFNGTSAFAVAQASPSFDVESFTLEGWIFPNDLSVRRAILDFSSPSGPLGVHFWMSAGTNVTMLPGSLFGNIRDKAGGNHAISTGPNVLSDKKWQHVALTYDKVTGLASLYANGVAVLTESVGVVNPNTALPLYLGYRFPGNSFYNGAPPFGGAMDEITIYDRALSASEIRGIFSAHSEGKCRNTLWARQVRSSVVLTWLSAATNTIPETSSALGTTWFVLTNPPTGIASGRRQGLTRPASEPREFFRLNKKN